jgi:hypothetical protein
MAPGHSPVGEWEANVPWQRRPEGQARPEELLRRFSARIQQLAERARAAVLAAVPEAVEQVRPNRGYFGYRLRHQFAFVEPQQNHVRVGFPLGALLEDPAGLLEEDASRTLRYVRLLRPADARRAELASLLQRASALHPARRQLRGRVQLKQREGPARPRPGRGRGR